MVHRTLLGAAVLSILLASPCGYPQEAPADDVLPRVVVQTFEGQVEKVDREAGTIIVKGKDTELTFDVPQQSKIFKDDEISGFRDILEGDLATIKYYIDSFGVRTVLSVTLQSYGSDFSLPSKKGSKG